MKYRQKRLLLEQVSKKLQGLEQIGATSQPSGWIHTIRTALNMSLSQLGKRVHKTAQGVRALEQRELTGAITLQSLKEVAEALDMRLVYAIVPKEGTLEEMVTIKAEEKAREIVNRTHTTMELEDQANAKGRLMNAYVEKKNELKNEMPKFLWD